MATTTCITCGLSVDRGLITCSRCGTPIGYQGATPVTSVTAVDSKPALSEEKEHLKMLIEQALNALYEGEPKGEVLHSLFQSRLFHSPHDAVAQVERLSEKVNSRPGGIASQIKYAASFLLVSALLIAIGIGFLLPLYFFANELRLLGVVAAVIGLVPLLIGGFMLVMVVQAFAENLRSGVRNLIRRLTGREVFASKPGVVLLDRLVDARGAWLRTFSYEELRLFDQPAEEIKVASRWAKVSARVKPDDNGRLEVSIYGDLPGFLGFSHWAVDGFYMLPSGRIVEKTDDELTDMV